MRAQTVVRSPLMKLLLNRGAIVVLNALIALALVEVASLLWGGASGPTRRSTRPAT